MICADGRGIGADWPWPVSLRPADFSDRTHPPAGQPPFGPVAPATFTRPPLGLGSDHPLRATRPATAITVLRQAGYHKHALSLAFDDNRHKMYLKLLLEDTNNYQEALRFIGSLPMQLADKYAKQYGKLLIEKLPEQTTELLKNLCIGYTAKPYSRDRSLTCDGTGSDQAPAYYFLIY